MGSAYSTDVEAAARHFGEALRKLRYAEDELIGLLGENAYSGETENAIVGERRLPDTHLATAVRLFFLGLPVSANEARRALGRRGLDALAATGLAEVGSDVLPRVRILPVGSLLVASDDAWDEGDDGNKRRDYVAAYTPTSRVLDSLTPRRHVARALDVGTGSGVHALLAARHARRVVATDVNPRALNFTELNAALNGFANIECRRGSLFEPAEGERFDLITCNAPYVVSPEDKWEYRDAGLPADELSERVVRGAAAHLADDGFATLMASWVGRDEDEPDEHVLAWTDDLGCDCWVLPVWGADALGHAAAWNDHLLTDARGLGDALDAWTGYLDDLGVNWVSEGAIVLHRRRGRRHTTRVDVVDDDLLEAAGDYVQRAFTARARLAELDRNDSLLEARIAVAAPLLLERELKPVRNGAADEATIELTEATHLGVETTPTMLDVMASLDGRAALGDRVRETSERLGLSEEEERRLRREAARVTRELLELGALRWA